MSHSPELAGLVSAPLEAARDEVEASAPFLTEHPRLSLAAAGTAVLGGAYLYRRHTRARGLERAAALISQVGGQRFDGRCYRMACWMGQPPASYVATQ